MTPGPPSFSCPTCTQQMAERFTRTDDPERPAVVMQCQRCWGVFIAEAAQQILGISSRVHALESGEVTGRRCPTCERQMKLVTPRAKWALFEKVELDKCPACDGLFFDPGELQKALGRVASIAGAPDDEYLKTDPRRVSSQMGDPAGPWSGNRYGRDASLDPLLDLLFRD